MFDAQGSYSIGTVAVDPKDPLVIWVGTGENNSQRSVGYGDGVYKSTDGGRTWNTLGLKSSNHIGKILIDPRNTSVVYVSAMGPLWSGGGDRGVYKTTDGGKSWAQSLKGDEWTGAYDLAFDPRNPDVIFATTYQRARRQWGFIDGGPGSAIWKSTDAGATWTKLTRGIPHEELGKIGLAVAQTNGNIVYAIVEAANPGRWVLPVGRRRTELGKDELDHRGTTVLLSQAHSRSEEPRSGVFGGRPPHGDR